ncbi:MAG: hypothetical protein ED557_02040 [Balneola sp.]|nr:MAG: hypothetical protein ED557_02040 [Balneola sp.]
MLPKLLKVSLLMLPLIVAAFFLLNKTQSIGVVSGIFLGLGSILVSAWVIDSFFEREWEVFNKVFFLSVIGRFFLVLIVFSILLGATKIDEIYFTVSFIISYLCYSMTEMIFFNKLLVEKSSKK